MTTSPNNLKDTFHSKSKAGLKIRRAPRAYFWISDADLKKKIQNWMERRADAEQHISAYLKMIGGGNLIRTETPFYKVDEEGYVQSINFQYHVPLLHTGWTGIKGTNWLIPETSDVERDLKSLPPLPSYSEINDYIDWPEANIDAYLKDMHIEDYPEFAERANRSAKLFAVNQDVFVSLPFPKAFADHPEYMQKVQGWLPPEGLEQITAKQGKFYQRLASLEKTSIGRAALRMIF